MRAASVRNLAAQYHPDAPHTEHVARLALEIWDALADAGRAPGRADERELLWAAAMLHDIGTAVDYDDHHKHSRYLILNAGLPGFSPRETALIGQMARYHRKGQPGLREFAPLARKGDEELLARCAAVLRVAEQLERARDQAVRHAARARRRTARVELAARRATTDVTVSRWARPAPGGPVPPRSTVDLERPRSRRELHDLVDAARAVRVLHVDERERRERDLHHGRVHCGGSGVPWRPASAGAPCSIAAHSALAHAPRCRCRSSAR